MSILDDIYDAMTDDQALARLPCALSADVGARSCVIQLFSDKGDLVDRYFDYFASEHFEFYAENALYKMDNWQGFARSPDLIGNAVNFDEHIGLDEFRRTLFYNEFFRAYGDDTARCLGGCFPIGEEVVVLGLHRAGGDHPFQPSQLSRTQEMADHLRRLFAARQALGRARCENAELAAALDAPRIGILRVDGRGSLVHANAAGLEILRLADGVRLLGQILSVQAGGLQSRFAEAIRTAAVRSGGQGDAMLVPRPSGKAPWRVIIAPDQAYASGGATVLIEQPGAGDLRVQLAALYQLTPAESGVAALLAEGLSPAKIAERRTVSLDTVRNQIKALLQKTGATRLGGLIALLARTVRTH